MKISISYTLTTKGNPQNKTYVETVEGVKTYNLIVSPPFDHRGNFRMGIGITKKDGESRMASMSVTYANLLVTEECEEDISMDVSNSSIPDKEL